MHFSFPAPKHHFALYLLKTHSVFKVPWWLSYNPKYAKPCTKDMRQPSTMTYSTNMIAHYLNNYNCIQKCLFLGLLELCPPCVLQKSWNIMMYSQICIFTNCGKFSLFYPSTLFQAIKNHIIRKALQFPFQKGITSLCLGKVWFYRKKLCYHD